MAVYVSEHKRLHAQRALDQHLQFGPDGKCLGCGEIPPCQGRKHAYGLFIAMKALPRRKPQAPAHGRLDAAGDGFGWFGGGEGVAA